jgi:hypothetical protein
MTEEISNKTTNEYREKVEKLRKSYSAVEYYLSNASDSIEELDGIIKSDDARGYLSRLTGFMISLSSDLEHYISSMAEGNPAQLNFMFPVGLDPKSLFFSDEK